jgi:hypothetical protein
MMDKRHIILVDHWTRKIAYDAISEAPIGWNMRLSPPKRTPEQSAKFHAICTDLEKSKFPWAGKPRNAAAWKVLLISAHAVATKEGHDMVPGIEGEFVNLRESTASMSVRRSSSLIEYSTAFCVSNGVTLHDAAADRGVTTERKP